MGKKSWYATVDDDHVREIWEGSPFRGETFSATLLEWDDGYKKSKIVLDALWPRGLKLKPGEIVKLKPPQRMEVDDG